jgi:hypothetical protein
MSFLLPETHVGTLRSAKAIDIHGDRHVDIAVELDDPASEVRVGRVPATEVPAGLVPGQRVSVRFVMGVMVRVETGAAG